MYYSFFPLLVGDGMGVGDGGSGGRGLGSQSSQSQEILKRNDGIS